MQPDYSAVYAYIDSQRQLGVADGAIYQSMLASGWPMDVARQALASHPAQQPAVAPVAEPVMTPAATLTPDPTIAAATAVAQPAAVVPGVVVGSAPTASYTPQSIINQQAAAGQPAGNPTAAPSTEAQQGFLKGRLGRLGFLLALIYFLLFMAVDIGIAYVLPGPRIVIILTLLVGVLGALLALPIALSTHVRRWHDLGKSGWCTALGFVPFFGQLLFIALLVWPGSKDTNEFGPRLPRSLSPWSVWGFSRDQS